MRKSISLILAVVLLSMFTFGAVAQPNENASKGTIEALKKRNELKRKRRMATQTSGTATMTSSTMSANSGTSGTKM